MFIIKIIFKEKLKNKKNFFLHELIFKGKIFNIFSVDLNQIKFGHC